MFNEKIFNRLKNFDPELADVLKTSLDRQLLTLSLIPTDNAASPMSQFLKGSEMGNDFIGHNESAHVSRIEQLARKRLCRLFGAEYAVVRTGNAVAASRVVLMALLNPGDTVLSFNLRKSEHCSGEQMRYNFVKFSLRPDNFTVDFDAFHALALRTRPALIIYSPVNYPKNIDFTPLRRTADEVGALLWIDIGQNAPLVAAKKIKSPVPVADVVTFSAADGLHGPQNGLILMKSKFAELMENTVVATGHASLKKNVMAALAITLFEADCDEFGEFAQEVLDNARALEKGLQKGGGETLCSPTENHLVLLKVPPGKDAATIETNLAEAGLLVKSEYLLTSDDKISYPIFRLSSLGPTTRGLKADEIFTVALALGEFVTGKGDATAAKGIGRIVKETVRGLPLFSEDWLPDGAIVPPDDETIFRTAMVYGM